MLYALWHHLVETTHLGTIYSSLAQYWPQKVCDHFDVASRVDGYNDSGFFTEVRSDNAKKTTGHYTVTQLLYNGGLWDYLAANNDSSVYLLYH